MNLLPKTSWEVCDWSFGKRTAWRSRLTDLALSGIEVTADARRMREISKRRNVKGREM